jgi:hypothetical protein
MWKSFIEKIRVVPIYNKMPIANKNNRKLLTAKIRSMMINSSNVLEWN